MSDRVSISIGEDGIADVRLNRPDKMNALDNAMFDGICEAIDRLGNEPGVRVVVLSGEGKAFCAGLDLSSFSNSGASGGGDGPTSRLVPRTHGDANRPQHVAWGWRTLPVPVIAAIHGVAFGGGFQIACGADVRFTAPDTKHAVMEMKWGLVPDMAGIAIMRTVARDDVIRDLTYTHRVFLGDEAKEYGFATHVTKTPFDDAMAMAKHIARKNPDAVRASKRLLNLAQDERAAEILLAESEEQAKIIGTANQMESVMSEMQKREPKFADTAA